PNRSANRHHGHLAGAELMMKALFLIDFGGVLHERAYTRIPLPAKELSPAYDLRNPPAPLLRCRTTRPTLKSTRVTLHSCHARYRQAPRPSRDCQEGGPRRKVPAEGQNCRRPGGIVSGSDRGLGERQRPPNGC